MDYLDLWEKTNRYLKRGKQYIYRDALYYVTTGASDTFIRHVFANNAIMTEYGLTRQDVRDVIAKAHRVVSDHTKEG